MNTHCTMEKNHRPLYVVGLRDKSMASIRKDKPTRYKCINRYKINIPYWNFFYQNPGQSNNR